MRNLTEFIKWYLLFCKNMLAMLRERVVRMSFIGVLKNMLVGDKREAVRFVSSEDVEKKLEACAKKRAQSLGEMKRKEIPNRYDVLFSKADWDNYFRVRIEPSQRRFELFVYRLGKESPYSIVGLPVVLLACDGSLSCGEVRVEGSFVEPLKGEFVQNYESGQWRGEEHTEETKAEWFEDGMSRPATMLAEDDVARTSTVPMGDDDLSRLETVSMGEEDISRLETVSMEKDSSRSKVQMEDCCNSAIESGFELCDTFVMPRDNILAYLTDSRDGRRYAVRPAYTVGLDVAGGHPKIALNPERFKYVSRNHGEFANNGVSWLFRNYGRNGTLIRSKNGLKAVELGPNESIALENGCHISFAGGPEYEWVSEVA